MNEEQENQTGTNVSISLPLPEKRVFRYEAMGDLLELLATNPDQKFSNAELTKLTGHNQSSVSKSLDLLEQLDLITRQREGRTNQVRINIEQLDKPEEPLFAIPQKEFYDPIKQFLNETKTALDNDLLGVIVFGSVARGTADRQSDIDLLIIVNEDNLMKSRRLVNDIRSRIEETKFNGDRYELQTMVEAPQAITGKKDDMRSIFTEGLPIHTTERFTEIKEEVFSA